jgi:hypothetical protein
MAITTPQLQRSHVLADMPNKFAAQRRSVTPDEPVVAIFLVLLVIATLRLTMSTPLRTLTVLRTSTATRTPTAVGTDTVRTPISPIVPLIAVIASFRFTTGRAFLPALCLVGGNLRLRVTGRVGIWLCLHSCGVRSMWSWVEGNVECGCWSGSGGKLDRRVFYRALGSRA